MKIRRKGVAPVQRRFTERLVENFAGLNTTYPYTHLADNQSPSFYNCRLYARNSTDRRVAVGTRKGSGFYSVPVGEAEDIAVTSVTGADDESFTNTDVIADVFENTDEGRLTKIALNIKEGTDPTQHIIVKIYDDNSGEPGTLLATSSILSSEIGTSYAYEIARFIEAPLLEAATEYWVVASVQAGGSGNYLWSSNTSTSTALTSTDSGGSWTSQSFGMNLKTYVSDDAPMLGGERYTPSAGAATTVMASGTDVYKISDVDGSTTSLKSGLTAAENYFFAQSNDELYCVNGVDAPQYWDGTTWDAVGGSPGTSKFIAFHKNRLFFVSASDPTKLVFSDLGDYQTYESTSFIYAPAPKSGDPITGIIVFQDNLTVFTAKTKYVLFGDDPGNFVLRQSSGKKGAMAQATIKTDPNYIYFLADDGVYRYNGSADELMSDPIQTEIDNIEDKTKCTAVVQDNYYRLYYPKTGSTTSDSSIVWDTLNTFWLRDSNTFISHAFVDEDNRLIEGSSRSGAVFFAGVEYSDLGRPIEFKYYTKYFGDGLRKLFLRRVVPSIRLQTQPYEIDIMIDIDQRDTVPLQYTINALAAGELWGGGAEFGDGTMFGSSTVSQPKTIQGSDGLWHQVRFEQTGVDTPVEILSFVLQFRVRRIE